MKDGREFHERAAATGNARSPILCRENAENLSRQTLVFSHSCRYCVVVYNKVMSKLKANLLLYRKKANLRSAD